MLEAMSSLMQHSSFNDSESRFNRLEDSSYDSSWMEEDLSIDQFNETKDISQLKQSSILQINVKEQINESNEESSDD